jgi:hypothetical protein
MNNIDFVIPVKNINIIIRCVIESLIKNYNPSKIYIITSKINNVKLIEKIKKWNFINTEILIIEEEDYFMSKYGLSIENIKKWYNKKDESSREFGWWYQQILKLGAHYRINDLSDPYMVWDSDLIVLNKWNIYPSKECNYYKFAILQETAKNEWNKKEYKDSIYDLIGLEGIDPIEGTFVPHHFIIYHDVVKNMISSIKNSEDKTWIERIMRLSEKYYRFSEYKCLATYMYHNNTVLLKYHKYEDYGKDGIRYRENREIIDKIKNNCEFDEELSYDQIINFVSKNYNNTVSYIQIEHVEE